MKACTRCGTCCKAHPCGLSVKLLGTFVPDEPMEFIENKEICKALEFEGNIHVCGLVRSPSKYIDLGETFDWKDKYLGGHFATFLGIGMGCCICPSTEEIKRAFREAINGR